MNIFMLIMMIIIGAVLGGATNFLAIRMLFRPYTPKYIGSFRLPFTPGLIPRRRKDMAVQLGHLVVQYLLTPESIKKKVDDASFRHKIMTWLQKESMHLLRSEMSISNVIEILFQEKITKESLKKKTEEILKEKLNNIVSDQKEKKIKEVVPPYLLEEIRGVIPTISHSLTEKGAVYFQTREGREQLELLLNKYLEGKGSMMNFVGMMFGSERIVDKVQPEIVRFFEDDSSEKMIRQFLEKEWRRIEEKPFELVVSSINIDKLAETLTNQMTKEVSLYAQIDKPLCEWTPQYEKIFVDKWLPNTTDFFLRFLSERFIFLFEQFQLEELIRDQVDAFSVSRFEAMVLTIARRELKMITYLGGIIGGIVGFVQGVLVLLF